jgi:hypothetical protein
MNSYKALRPILVLFASAQLLVASLANAAVPTYQYRLAAKGVAASTAAPSAPAPADVDLSYANVSLLAGFDNSAVDAKGKTFTNTNVTFSSTNRFGGYSAQFGSALPGALKLPYDAASYDWFSSDYTVEAWVNASSWSAWVARNIPCLMGNADPEGNAVYWAFGPVGDGTVKFYYWNGAQNYISSTTALPTNSWSHIAFVKTGSTGTIYVNGVASGSSNIQGTPQSLASQPFTIGRVWGQSIVGFVDEVRITKGVARYVSNFTPPTAAFARH